jgi:hypothetical protein
VTDYLNTLEMIEYYTLAYTLITLLLFILAWQQYIRSGKQHMELTTGQVMNELESFTSNRADYINQVIYDHRTFFPSAKDDYSNAVCQVLTVFLQTLDNRIESSLPAQKRKDAKKYFRKQCWVQLHPGHRVKLKVIFGEYLETLSVDKEHYQIVSDRRHDFVEYFGEY